MKQKKAIIYTITNILIPEKDNLKKLGFTLYLEANHIIIEYKEKNYILKIKNNLSCNLYYNNKLLKKFKDNNINDIIKYLQEIN